MEEKIISTVYALDFDELKELSKDLVSKGKMIAAKFTIDVMCSREKWNEEWAAICKNAIDVGAVAINFEDHEVDLRQDLTEAVGAPYMR